MRDDPFRDHWLHFQHEECTCTNCDAVRKHHAIPGALCVRSSKKMVATWPIDGMNVWGPSPDNGMPFVIIGPSIPGTCGHRSDAIVILAQVDGRIAPCLTLEQWPTAIGIETRMR